MVRYPDPANPGAEICLNNGHAWRRFADGREQMLSAHEGDLWYERLARDNEASVRTIGSATLAGDRVAGVVASQSPPAKPVTREELIVALVNLRAVAIWDGEYVSKAQCERACKPADEIVERLIAAGELTMRQVDPELAS